MLDVLDGGTFASVWEARFASGEEAIVKIAPPDDAPSLLLYEERMLRTEAMVMRLAEERGWPYPRLLLLDTSRQTLPVDVPAMSRMPGDAARGDVAGCSRAHRGERAGEVLGLIDVERALWADPLFDVVTGDAMNVGAPDPRLAAVEGFTPAELARIRIYRVWFTSVITTEILPRGFEGEWLVAYRAQLARNLEALLVQAGV
ncbi:MAG: hypothetical protein EAS51_08885 [Microbacteriaceae bacterium]|nr:MAG: hypothetical protein EAS51_08885 [Microbacteriaceae bacterium]